MKQYISILLLIAMFSFTACEDILECIINVRPELQNRDLEVGYVNQYYYDSILAEIKNEPFDDGYDYYFNVSGHIPKGIEVYYEYREVIFEGVPQESGRFTIRVSLDVDAINEYYYDEYGNERYHDPLCTDNTSKVYTLVVR